MKSTPSSAARAAEQLVRKYKTRDPFELARCLGVEVIFWDGFSRLKGMYRVILRNRYIFINASLPEQTAAIVCAHELGHDRLHRALACGKGLQEFMLYDMASRPEYEANVFAATLLLPDDELLELIYAGYDAQQIASMMNTDINLIALKVQLLRQKGYEFCMLDSNTKFLK